MSTSALTFGIFGQTTLLSVISYLLAALLFGTRARVRAAVNDREWYVLVCSYEYLF